MTVGTDKLVALAQKLIDQDHAQVIVEPNERAFGFWFGGGNMVELTDGSLAVVGRYRNAGDSRTGIKAGERGLELAIFQSSDQGQSWNKVASWTKAELNVGDWEVLSIEGAALHVTDSGVELFVSTEKDHLGYPPGFESYLKPGTGVWTIERLQADSIETLKSSSLETILHSTNPEYLHIKDPFLYSTPAGDLILYFCTHPFNWSSSNTGFAVRKAGESKFSDPVYEFFPRGTTWDVSMTRGTAVVDVPPLGEFTDEKVSLIFYDGGECVRDLEEHSSAVKRPRGYSCEELGGLAYTTSTPEGKITRLSRYQPMFVSPHGTGCSRYVDVLTTSEGMYATWQQSQTDQSQPLVMNFVPLNEIEAILS
ncbi:MAG: exo-alpha-sialidase [Planctomycetaceae bacterium]|nr:exo-alpha-sialidase [Planctomycetaceae bacterium]